MSAPQKAEQLFDEINTYITTSQVMMKEGAFIELNGLDERIRILCESVMLLTQDERMQYAGRLQSLFIELQKLGDDMTVIRDGMAEEILSISSHRRASVAYRVADSVDGKKPEPEEE